MLLTNEEKVYIFYGAFRISATVRWLIGDKLGIHLSKPVVKCEILSGKILMSVS